MELDEFVKSFVARAGSKACYLENYLIPWYSRRMESNVLFLTYEQLLADTKAQVKRVAEFLGQENGRRVSTDPGLLQRVVDLSTKERMRPFLKDFIRQNVEFVVKQRERRNARIAPELQKLLEHFRHHPPRHEFVRDGSVGGYKNFLTADNKAALKEWIAVKTSGTDVMRLWQDVGI